MVRVSVIVPIYNTGKFLEECIESVLNQTLTDWELILVNDGSPDKSDEICQRYLKKDSRIHYYFQKNAGVSVARNLGLSKSIGSYLYCMDSDDSLAPEFLETSYQESIKKDADITIIGEWYERRLPRPAALPTCAMMIKKSFLDKYPNIRYPEGIQPCEDGLFSHQLLALTDKIAFNPDGVYKYRQHEGGNHCTINKACDKVLIQIPKWFDILTQFYDQYQLWDKRAMHLLKFLEHEPFELRLCSMPFNAEQNQKLFDLIHTFYKNKLANRLEKEDLYSCTKKFRLFLLAESYNQFKRKYKNLLFCIHFIPLARIRHKLLSIKRPAKK